MNRRAFIKRNGLWVIMILVFMVSIKAQVMPSARHIAAPKPQNTVPFLPTSISGLALWLRASDGSGNNVSVYKDYAGTQLASANDAVLRWNDESGNGFNFGAWNSQAPVYKSSIQHGLPAMTNGVVSAGNQSSMKITNSITASGSCSLFFVFNQATTTQTQYLLDSVTGRMICSASADSTKIGAYDGSWHDVATATLTGPYLAEYILKTGTTQASIYTNAVQCGSSFTYSATAIGGATAVFGGNSSATSPMIGYMMEVIIYNSALSTTDRQKVEAYLNAKYVLY